MKRKITSVLLLLAMLVSLVAVLPVASAAEGEAGLAGTDVTLTDGILLNFYIEADDTLEVTNATVKNGYYVITKELAAKEMGDAVSAQLETADGTVGEAYSSSVAEYAAGVLAGRYYPGAKALVTAMLNYGAAAQKYFNYETDKLVGTPVTDTSALLAAEVADVEITDEAGIYEGASLILDGTMKLRFYFLGNVELTVDGEAAEVVNRDSYCYVDIKVTPDNIDKTYEVASGDTVVKYSVLNYLKNNADNEKLSEIVASIYAYSLAAETYVVELEKSELSVDKFTTSSNGNDYAMSYNIREALGNKKFYPTEDDENGNDLYIEFSMLWNETLKNVTKGYALIGSIYNSGTSNKARPYWYALASDDDHGDNGCYSYGAGYFDTLGDKVGGDYALVENEDDTFPYIGEYGWHRIGVKYHLDVTWDGDEPVYSTVATLYIDGEMELAIDVSDQAISNEGYRFFSAEKDGDNIIYHDTISEDAYADVFRFYGTKSTANAYFVIKDAYVTVGDGFVFDVEKVGKTASASLAVDDGKVLDATAYFKFKGDADPEAKCDHENLAYDETTRATMFTEGEEVGHCSVCDRQITRKIDKTEPDVRVYDSSDSDADDFYLVNVYDDVLAGDHFYPTEDDPDGKSLFIEFSLLWNETLVNAYANTPSGSSKGYVLLGSMENKNASNLDRPFWMALTNNNPELWCQYAGGVEPDNMKKVYAICEGPTPSSDGGKDDFVNIGEYGWHRVGIEYRQTFIEKTDGSIEYTLYANLYFDGKLVSSYDYIMTGKTDYGSAYLNHYLYTVEKVDGEYVYTDIPDSTYVSAFRVQTPKTVDGTAYFPIADMYISCGNDFLLDVERVENPADATYELADGVEVDGSVHFKLAD